MSRFGIPSAKDTLFEWEEPVAVRKAMFVARFRICLLRLPISFPIFAGFGFLLFAAKVWTNGNSLKEIPFSALLLISVLLATLFSVFSFIEVVLKRFSPTIVRLKTDTLEKWRAGWGKEFRCGYDQIKCAIITKHNLAPKMLAISVTLKTGEQTYFGVPDNAIGKALEILKQKGVHCGETVELETPMQLGGF